MSDQVAAQVGMTLSGRDKSDAHRLPVDSLLGGNSPRLDGEDAHHIQVLSQADTPLPPILVHRGTMRVVDGMHRLAAAKLRGCRDIDVIFFDGTEDEAFVLAVKANTEHGLPLSLADREAATARLIQLHPQRSDRWIADVTGLAAVTVGIIRRRLGDAWVETRVGRDGRVRPVDSANGRRTASEAIAAHPHASLREIARMAGISPGTARDVRNRLRRGDDPVPSRKSRQDNKVSPTRPEGDGTSVPGRDRKTLLRNLQNDPSLRFTESGRKLLSCIGSLATEPGEIEDLVATVPGHCAYAIASLARRYAEEWRTVASNLERRIELTQ